MIFLFMGENQDQHDQRLDAVLKRLSDSNITLNLEKCEFSKTTVKVLGNILSSEGVRLILIKLKPLLTFLHLRM